MAPFKYVFRKFWIWAGGVLILGESFVLGGKDYHDDDDDYDDDDDDHDDGPAPTVRSLRFR